ncbi:MAG: hypothetical protein HFF83_07545 [Oscillibacter sp.]|jgi:hypothetical protein|nr:hypothetical protein [Oscillibacter sp.]
MNRYNDSLTLQLFKVLVPIFQKLGRKIWSELKSGKLSICITDGKIIIKSDDFIKGNAEISLSDLASLELLNSDLP